MNDTTTHVERLLWLAGLEVPCPNCFPFPDVVGRIPTIPHCKDCKGTGKVLRFPTLRRECSCIPDTEHPAYNAADGRVSVWHFNSEPVPRSRCPICKGRGGVPVDDLDATMPCAHEWHFEKWEKKDIRAMCHLTLFSGGYVGYGPNYNEAAVRVLYQEVRERPDAH